MASTRSKLKTMANFVRHTERSYIICNVKKPRRSIVQEEGRAQIKIEPFDWDEVYTDPGDNSNDEVLSEDPLALQEESDICQICGDNATGKHYGAFSCDGCKGFFRRSVRSNQVYTCRFMRRCVMNKDMRNSCRYCRLRKCIKVGMKRDAVQNERDRLNNKRPSYEQFSGISLATIVTADKESMPSRPYKEASKKNATIWDVCNHFSQELLAYIKWAKSLPSFTQFSLDDQVALLRATASEHLILRLVRRSLTFNNVLILDDNLVILRQSEDKNDRDDDNYNVDFSTIGTRIMDEIVQPLKNIHIDDSEFACLSAIVFFDPTTKGFSESDRIRSYRYQIQIILEEYISDRQYDSKGRFGEILLMLPVLQSISWQMIEQLHFAKLCGIVKVSSLFQEMILGIQNEDEDIVIDDYEETNGNGVNDQSSENSEENHASPLPSPTEEDDIQLSQENQ